MGVWGRGSSEESNWSPGLLDRAETFAESDVSVSAPAGVLSDGAVRFGEGFTFNETGSAAYSEAGVRVYPNTDLGFVRVKQYADYGADRVKVVDYGAGETLASEPIEPGGWATLEADMQEGTGYNILGYNEDGSTFSTYYDGDGEVYGNSIDISGGYAAGATQGNDTYVFEEFQTGGLETSASVTVEWPMPADLAGWDIIPYEATPDGGTVEVYAINPSDGTRLAGPLDDPGDISGLSRSTNVAVEVVLSRPSTSENPRLEAVYRRRKIT